MIDLHTHSTFSDGSLTPTQLVLEARTAGIEYLALTDHDTGKGLDEFIAACKENGIYPVPGVEFSVFEDPVTRQQMHILGLFLDHHHPDLTSFEALMKTKRRERAFQIIDHLESDGYRFSNEQKEQLTRLNTISRAHLAKMMIQNNYIHSVDEAFDRFFGVGKPYFLPKPQFSPEYIIGLIHNLGGLAMLAHPVYLNCNSYSELKSIIQDLKRSGLDGVEVYYPKTPKSMIHQLLTWCDELDLLISGGSDFHGKDIRPEIALGKGTGHLYIPNILIDQMQKRLHQNK